MDEELREKLIAGIEKSMLAVGGGKYSDGMQTARRMLGWMYENVLRLQTTDDLRKFLDECEPVSKREAILVAFVINHIPHIIRLGLKFAAQKAISALPAPPGGRPQAIAKGKIGEVLDCVAQLHRRGCTFDVAIKRTAQKFAVSTRTVQRLWARRESISDEELLPAPKMEDAFNLLLRGS